MSKPPSSTDKEEREAKLAAALRANLRRRKTAGRTTEVRPERISSKNPLDSAD